MKIILPGGSGQVGTLLARYFHSKSHDVLVLSRTPKPAPWRTMHWDGLTHGSWANELEGADAVIHLSGRSVNCRYTPTNRREIHDSRTLPTRLLGEVIASLQRPPSLWLNASTATIYRHALDRPQDEFTGEYARRTDGLPTPEQPGLPETWAFSAYVAYQWEVALHAVPTPHTRKIALRTSILMASQRGGIFEVLSNFARIGFGGTQGSGTQFVSWIHEHDYCRAIELLLARPEITDDSNSVINLASPNPLPNKEFQRTLHRAWGMSIGLPTPAPLLEIGTFFLRTESELVLKSRRVISAVLQRAGFQFDFPNWPEAVKDLVARMRQKR